MIRTMRRREPRQMDEEEEMWFQEDDDFADMNNKDLATTLGESFQRHRRRKSLNHLQEEIPF